MENYRNTCDAERQRCGLENLENLETSDVNAMGERWQECEGKEPYVCERDGVALSITICLGLCTEGQGALESPWTGWGCREDGSRNWIRVVPKVGEMREVHQVVRQVLMAGEVRMVRQVRAGPVVSRPG